MTILARDTLSATLSEPFKPHLITSPNPGAPLGRGQDHSIVTFTPARHKSLVIYGLPRSGKTAVASHLATGLLARGFDAIILAPGGGSSRYEFATQHLATPVLEEPAYIEGALAAIRHDVEAREAGDPKPPLFALVDYSRPIGPEGADLVDITRRGPQVGVHTIIVTDAVDAPAYTAILPYCSRLVLAPTIGADLALVLRNFWGKPWGSDSEYRGGQAVFENLEGTSVLVQPFTATPTELQVTLESIGR